MLQQIPLTVTVPPPDALTLAEETADVWVTDPMTGVDTVAREIPTVAKLVCGP
jgi:hypothetical protein